MHVLGQLKGFHCAASHSLFKRQFWRQRASDSISHPATSGGVVLSAHPVEEPSIAEFTRLLNS